VTAAAPPDCYSAAVPFLRRHLKPLSALAFIAIVALVLVPSLARAGAGDAQYNAITGVCTTSDGGATGLHLDEHCPLCGVVAAPPPPGATPAFATALDPAPGAVRPGVPIRLRPWSQAPPRAPPSSTR
jgi:hypothetical protein